MNVGDLVLIPRAALTQPVFCLMTSVKTEGSRAVFPGGPDSALGYVWGSS